jgi:Mg-chelatase subunit ChlD
MKRSNLSLSTLNGAGLRVFLTLSHDEYSDSRSIADDLALRLSKPVFRVPQSVSEYNAEEYLSSRTNSIIHIPFFSQRTKQMFSRILHIARESNSIVVLGAHVDDADELRHYSNLLDIVVVGAQVQLPESSVPVLLDVIASSNVEKVVEMMRRSKATPQEIMNFVLFGQLLIRGIDLQRQPQTEGSIHRESRSSLDKKEEVFDMLEAAFRKLQDMKRPVSRTSSHTSSRTTSAKRIATHGRQNRALVRNSSQGMLSLFHTLIAASPYQNMRRSMQSGNDRAYLLEKEDIRRYPYESSPVSLNILVLDSSGSMAGSERIRYAKGLVRSFVRDGYRKRAYSSLIIARGEEAKITVHPTKRINHLIEELLRVPTGGRTPLSDSLQKSLDVARVFRRREPSAEITVSLLTDGKETADKHSADIREVFTKERITRRVFDSFKNHTAQAFADRIGASFHVIGRSKR